MSSPSARPRVGISRCLLGDAVRHDGGHKYDASLVDLLGPAVEWVAVCPELEVGMGVPREPVELIRGTDDALHMLALASRTDWTSRMNAWTTGRVRALAALGLSGYVLKSRSPSCGLHDTPVRHGEPGAGLFTRTLLDLLPGLPVEDEVRLRDDATRARFLERVRHFEL